MEQDVDEKQAPKRKAFFVKVIPFLLVLYGLLIVYIALLVFSPPVRELVMNWLLFFIRFDPALGTLWAFLFMAIGNSSNVPVGIPATFFFAKSIPFNDLFWLNLVLYSFAAGFGAALGQLAVYAIGRGAAAALKDNKGVKNLQFLANLITERKKMAPVLVYIIALTPIPDQLIMVPLGIAKYPLKKTIIPSALGKASFSFFLALGATIFHETRDLPTISSLIQEALFMVIIFTVLVMCITINWEETFSKYTRKQLSKDAGTKSNALPNNNEKEQ